MSTHTIQLYPSPENCQRTDVDEISFRIAVQMLQDIVDRMPVLERSTARLTGWMGVRLVADHTDTADEVNDKRTAIVTEMIAAGHGGLTADEVAGFAARLAAV